MVKRREKIPHKRARIEDSQTGNNDIHNATKSRNFSSCMDGKHGVTVPSNKEKREKKPKNGVNQQGDLASPLVSQNHYNSGMPTGKIEDRR